MNIHSPFVCKVEDVANTPTETVFTVGSPDSLVDHLIMDSIAVGKYKLTLTTLTTEMGNLGKHSFTGAASAHNHYDIVCSGIKFFSDLKALAFCMA